MAFLFMETNEFKQLGLFFFLNFRGSNYLTPSSLFFFSGYKSDEQQEHK